MGVWDGNGYHPADDEYYERPTYGNREPAFYRGQLPFADIEDDRRTDVTPLALEDDCDDPSAGGLITYFGPYPGRHAPTLAWALSTDAPAPAEDKGGWGAPSPTKPKPRPRILTFMTSLLHRAPRLP